MWPFNLRIKQINSGKLNTFQVLHISQDGQTVFFSVVHDDICTWLMSLSPQPRIIAILLRSFIPFADSEIFPLPYWNAYRLVFITSCYWPLAEWCGRFERSFADFSCVFGFRTGNVAIPCNLFELYCDERNSSSDLELIIERLSWTDCHHLIRPPVKRYDTVSYCTWLKRTTVTSRQLM